MRVFFFFLLSSLCASDFLQLERESQLYRSSQWIQQLTPSLARLPISPHEPQTTRCLSQASIWLTLEPGFLGAFPLSELAKKESWILFRELGVQAIGLQGLGSAIQQPHSERNYELLTALAHHFGISLIGSPLDPLSTNGADFQLALAAYKDYSHLFHLIEINPQDWGVLPESSSSSILSMATVQNLRTLGYLGSRSEQIYPYSAQSCWEATAPVLGSDGKIRRWVFLRIASYPALNWLDPSFVSEKLAGGAIAHALLRLSQSILSFESAPIFFFSSSTQSDFFSPPDHAISSLALLTRKLGGFSTLRIPTSLEKIKEIPTDFVYDRFTPLALLHALLTEDTKALRIIYRIFLEQKFSPQKLIHELTATHSALCEWNAFLENPKPKVLEEKITAELLAERLLKSDVLRLDWTPSEYAPPKAPLFGICPLEAQNPINKTEQQKARFLFAFFYAMQGGVFSFSSKDLAGASLFAQLHHPHSFAKKLQQLFKLRTQLQMERAELIEVIPASQPAFLLFLHRLPNGLHALLALNFSRSSHKETLSHSLLAHHWVIDALSGQAAPKSFASNSLEIQLDALAGKVYLLQPKATRFTFQ